jgi:hypothetical protein
VENEKGVRNGRRRERGVEKIWEKRKKGKLEEMGEEVKMSKTLR